MPFMTDIYFRQINQIPVYFFQELDDYGCPCVGFSRRWWRPSSAAADDAAATQLRCARVATRATPAHARLRLRRRHQQER